MRRTRSKVVNNKEIKELFDEFVLEHRIRKTKTKNFESFLKFLEVDFYDWIKENLRSYFKE
jgi:hypothetical protein